jgi:hypothetical protein
LLLRCFALLHPPAARTSAWAGGQGGRGDSQGLRASQEKGKDENENENENEGEGENTRGR